MKMKVKPATIARIGALLVALANQCLVMFGQDILPFTENMAYQVVSLVAVVVIAAINAWYNNDISKVALLCGGVFDALSDGKITEEEIEKMLAEAEDPEKVEEAKKGNFIVNFINGIIESLKAKIKKE
jgi:SPP1 family holin